MKLPAVWLLRSDEIAPDSPEADALAAMLSEDEQQRRHSYRHAAARHQFVLSRGLLRKVLGAQSGLSPEQLRFERLPSGKPRLASDPELHFSLSHSGDWIALAVSREAPIGIDIEQPRKSRNILRIARHYFHRDECALLESLSHERQLQHFYRLWTIKEAFFKARGTGISEGLGKINLAGFHLGKGVQFDPTLLDTDPDWQFYYAERPLPEASDLHLALVSRDSGVGDCTPVRFFPKLGGTERDA